jgi:hypothetical protein
MSNFSFDDSEFAEGANTAEEVVQSLEASPTPAIDPAEDPELADVDLRLETADYYRAILNHDFFDVQSPAAQIVDREIRSFIRERLEVLLGLRTPRVEAEAQFEEDEVTALKLLAATVLKKKPGLTGSESPVKKMATPTPSPKPVVRPKPQARKIPAPAPAPSTKPKLKPGPKPKAQSPAPAPAAKTEAREGGVSQTYISHEGKEVTLVEGETIEENGRKYIVAMNEKGTLYRKDITGQVVAPGRLPPMTPQQFSMLSQRQAEEQISRLDDTTGLAIVASLRPQ